MEIKDKVAIVTGASKGIGLATCQLLLDNGMKVAGWSRSMPDINNPNFRFFQVDVSDEEQVKEAYLKTKAAFGNDVHVLINNAGLGFEGAFEEMPTEKWHTMFKVNVDGIFFCSREAIPDMKRIGEAHIINISSIAGTNGIERMAGYCGTKFAVRGISHSMFKELRQSGIKVTCIYPGSTKTNFFDDFTDIQANDNMMMPEDIAETIMHALQSSPNFHHVDIEVRPLKPRG